MAKGILLNCKPDQAIHLLKILQQLHRYETGLYYHTDFILFYPRLPSLFLLTFLFIQNYVKHIFNSGPLNLLQGNLHSYKVLWGNLQIEDSSLNFLNSFA